MVTPVLVRDLMLPAPRLVAYPLRLLPEPDLTPAERLLPAPLAVALLREVPSPTRLRVLRFEARPVRCPVFQLPEGRTEPGRVLPS